MSFNPTGYDSDDFGKFSISGHSGTPSSYREVKRHLSNGFGSRALAAIAILSLLPVFVIFATGIAAANQNPIFVQQRLGKGRRKFRVFKFRTIWDEKEMLFSMPAVSAWHQWYFRHVSEAMRLTGMDELPQLFNVLRGEMLFFGPRPLTAEDYFMLPEGRSVRCLVRPGITGLAQVNGGQELSPELKLLFDIYFIKKGTLSMRLYILRRTIARLAGFSNVTNEIDRYLQQKAEDSLKSRANSRGQSAVECE